MPIATLENCKINYIQINHNNIKDQQPEDIVMIHGLATNLAFWYNIANQLNLKDTQGKQINTRITLFDLPGHGRSSMLQSGYNCDNMSSILSELIEYLNLKKIHLITHSFGGSIGLTFAHKYPEKIKSLVLADVRLKILQPQQLLSNWHNWEILDQQLRQININISPDESEAGFQLLTEIAKSQVNQQNNSSVELKNNLDLLPFQQNIHTAKKWLNLIETTPAMIEFKQPEPITESELQHLKLPTFLIYGANSPNLITKIKLEQLGNITNSYIVEKAGHFFPLSKPHIFLNQTSQFLEKIIKIESNIPD